MAEEERTVGGLRVAFQGEHGAFAEEAAHALYGPTARTLPVPTFRAVFAAVAEGAADAGVVPVDNSLAGPVAETYDALLEHAVPISGAVEWRVRHCLVGPPGLALGAVTRALSHPLALAQCSRFLQARGIEPAAESNTARSARRVAQEVLPGTAAVASRAAAERYGLQVLAEDIEDAEDNCTRFLALGVAPPVAAGPGRTSVALAVEEGAPAALARVLGTLGARGLRLAKLEVRPRRRGWERVLFLDVEGLLEEAPVREALAEAARACTLFRVLGSYRALAEVPSCTTSS